MRPAAHAEPFPGLDAALKELRCSLEGIVDSSSLARALHSSDASNYRVTPEIVIMPRHRDDAITAVTVAQNHGIPITARGGGTSCARNAIGPGMIIDFSRFMSRIISIDPASRSAVVEPGVILSDLQKAAAPYGMRFGPDPSTATRCTIGGMIGNNACGPHGLSYGRTADNVRSMTWLTGTGEIITAGAGPEALDAVPGLRNFVSENMAVLRTDFGRFGRQISG
ncbi:FAD-binding oxidoreductase [Arthrobacter sp. NPDC056727]|uniref:FAD-binding oxidoreductase n=1 Tax=Arthrobacter sp. NPDC056727 TaxID=3345927 RepID=UPI00366E14DA